MRTIYLDEEYRCFVEEKDGMTAYETDAFDGKCNAYIEGFRLVPEEAAWTAPNGIVYTGVMIAPHKDFQMLEAVQSAYNELYEILMVMMGVEQ